MRIDGQGSLEGHGMLFEKDLKKGLKFVKKRKKIRNFDAFERK